MKKISLFFASMFMLVSFSFAQTQKTAAWTEMQAFEKIMNTSFAPVEKGNYATLTEKASELYKTSKVWYAANVPAGFKEAETRSNLEKLMIKCNDIWAATNSKTADAKVKVMVEEAKFLFNKINTDCRKSGK